MSVTWKRRILINDPISLDPVQIQQDLYSGNQVIVQFSDPSTYGSILDEVNELCARFDENFGVRFYGHYSVSFDCETLLQIPNVKMLLLNCLRQSHNTNVLAKLNNLYSLSVGIYELENSEILSIDTLRSLSILNISSEKKTLNLEYLKEFSRLEQLHVIGKVKNLDAIGDLEDLTYLALHSISNKPLHFINRLKKLKELRILLGGREHIQDIEENEIESLEICRVRGFHDLSNISVFRALKKLVIEDQIQLREINFDQQMKTLEELTIMNCKTLAHLTGMEHLPFLHKLRIFKTAIDFDSFIEQELPIGLTTLEFATFKRKVDQEIQKTIVGLGYQNGIVYNENRG
ncbi:MULTISPECIES: hypothetical protein [Paenibacillus]|uniref:hypothetical protein n=1 Tax=Paenibacillus TaxID=44249 RepID=UPI00096E0FC2|nr:hypothetical protein [Paenibacillus odorifer]OMD15808.1 hypothetical protein BJP50_00370 [Paenibacillus odorifer]OZQ77836.1 hypothetical protein CA596_06140 [Paenibacillus odorifer]